MAEFIDKVSYRAYRVWRFLKLNWRNLIVISIGLVGISGLLWSLYQVFTSPIGGNTFLYGFFAGVFATVAYIAYTSKRGRFDYLLLDEDD